MLLQPKTFVKPQTFFCRGYNKRIPIFVCMNNFVDANALKKVDTPCFNCVQGQDVRCGYSQS